MISRGYIGQWLRMNEIVASNERGVATIVLNRPGKANALDAPTVEALHAALDRAIAAPAHLIVLRAEGRNFCAGFDFSGFEDTTLSELCWRFIRIEQFLQRLAHAPCNTMALAQGGCFGAGADLVLACHERLAAPDARFRMPGWRFGLALGTRRLAARIGADGARRFLESAAILDAAAAAPARLIDAVVDRVDWQARVDAAGTGALALTPEARACLAAIVTPDTRALDMASLVESLTAGDLKARIRAFRTEA